MRESLSEWSVQGYLFFPIIIFLLQIDLQKNFEVGKSEAHC